MAIVAAGPGRVGAERAGVASHDATCEASEPLPDGPDDAADVVKGV
jgi:hypothetical protein